jgi:hypothetical protein
VAAITFLQLRCVAIILSFICERLKRKDTTDITLLQSGLELRDVILLDSQSTTNIFCNPKFVEDIRPAETPLLLNTNGGVLITTLKAIVPDFGEVWFNQDSITNIVCMADIDDKYGLEWSTVNGKKAIRVMTDPPIDFVPMMNLMNGHVATGAYVSQ